MEKVQFLNRRSAKAEIYKILSQGSKKRFAVAFWGECDEVSKVKKCRILCDLTSGSTDPDVISRLRAYNEIRHVPKLHAKIYGSDQGLIVGSMNFSKNGFINNEEAAIGTDDKVAIKNYKKWFDEIWKDKTRSFKITNELLSIAMGRFLANPRNGDGGQKKSKSTKRRNPRSKLKLDGALVLTEFLVETGLDVGITLWNDTVRSPPRSTAGKIQIKLGKNKIEEREKEELYQKWTKKFGHQWLRESSDFSKHFQTIAKQSFLIAESLHNKSVRLRECEFVSCFDDQNEYSYMAYSFKKNGLCIKIDKKSYNSLYNFFDKYRNEKNVIEETMYFSNNRVLQLLKDKVRNDRLRKP